MMHHQVRMISEGDSPLHWADPGKPALGQAGARVLVHGRDAERGARVIAEVDASGGVASFLAANSRRSRRCVDLPARCRRTVGRLDILINDAGIGPHSNPPHHARIHVSGGVTIRDRETGTL